jgi:hypothetical protein
MIKFQQGDCLRRLRIGTDNPAVVVVGEPRFTVSLKRGHGQQFVSMRSGAEGLGAQIN